MAQNPVSIAEPVRAGREGKKIENVRAGNVAADGYECLSKAGSEPYSEPTYRRPLAREVHLGPNSTPDDY